MQNIKKNNSNNNKSKNDFSNIMENIEFRFKIKDDFREFENM